MSRAETKSGMIPTAKFGEKGTVVEILQWLCSQKDFACRTLQPQSSLSPRSRRAPLSWRCMRGHAELTQQADRRGILCSAGSAGATTLRNACCATGHVAAIRASLRRGGGAYTPLLAKPGTGRRLRRTHESRSSSSTPRWID